MMNVGHYFLMFMMISQIAQAQSVPEGIHKDRAGAPTLCGLTSATLADIERQVLNDKEFVEENSTDQYRVFNRERDFVQMVFPRLNLHPFAMATCRKLVESGSGTTMQRGLECDGTRAQCDAVFLEFRALDDRMLKSLKR